jgi:type II secretory pathway pseudopilin PulG
LVVIAIIALLLALLSPSLRRAKFLTRVTVCGASLGQVGRAMTTYAEANRWWLPSIKTRNQGTGRNCWDVAIAFVQELYAQGVSEEMLFCPDNYDICKATVRDDGRWWFNYYYDPDNLDNSFHRLRLMDWVPRPEGQFWPPDPSQDGDGFVVFDTEVFRGPMNASDAEAIRNPVMTDTTATYKNFGGDPPIGLDLSVTPPEDVDLTTRATHMYDGLLERSNQVFIDGHMESIHASELKPRYYSHTNNWVINWH